TTFVDEIKTKKLATRASNFKLPLIKFLLLLYSMTNIVIRERDIISSLIDVLSIFSITFSIHLFISSITLLI
ncbi:hypothetical protein, partial [Clostridium perfringens]